MYILYCNICRIVVVALTMNNAEQKRHDKATKREQRRENETIGDKTSIEVAKRDQGQQESGDGGNEERRGGKVEETANKKKKNMNVMFSMNVCMCT